MKHQPYHEVTPSLDLLNQTKEDLRDVVNGSNHCILELQDQALYFVFDRAEGTRFQVRDKHNPGYYEEYNSIYEALDAISFTEAQRRAYKPLNIKN